MESSGLIGTFSTLRTRAALTGPRDLQREDFDGTVIDSDRGVEGNQVLLYNLVHLSRSDIQ